MSLLLLGPFPSGLASNHRASDKKRQLQVIIFSKITVQTETLSVVSDLAWNRHMKCDRAGQRNTREGTGRTVLPDSVWRAVMPSACSRAEEGDRGIRWYRNLAAAEQVGAVWKGRSSWPSCLSCLSTSLIRQLARCLLCLGAEEVYKLSLFFSSLIDFTPDSIKLSLPAFFHEK